MCWGFIFEQNGEIMVRLDTPREDEITLDEAMKRFDVSPIVRMFGTWVVSDYGVECLTRYYPIQKNRLQEQDWPTHMGGKVWVHIGDFLKAREYAREYHSKISEAGHSGNS